MSWVGTAIGVGVVASGAGAAVGANQASKDRAGARGVANMPGLDIPAAVGEAEQLTPRTRELEAQRNAFNRAQLWSRWGFKFRAIKRPKLSGHKMPWHSFEESFRRMC